MFEMQTALVLAQEWGSTGATTFWGTGAGKLLGAILGIVGVCAVIAALFFGVKDITSGKPGAAVKKIVGSICLAAVMFNPAIINSGIGLAGKLIDKVISSAGEVNDKTV